MITSAAFHVPATALRFVALCAVVGTLVGVSVASDGRAEAHRPIRMFIQLSDGMAVDPDRQTLRLVNADDQAVYFADEPVRMAGHIPLDDFLKEWAEKAGADNFANAPPNATLSVYEPGKVENTLSVVQISHPKVEGADLVYSYRKIDGTVPKKGGATSLFIDWTDVGDGFGFGFRGVGVGFRGPGVL